MMHDAWCMVHDPMTRSLYMGCFTQQSPRIN